MSEKIIGYCVKCKEKREMKVTENTNTSKGVPMAKGICVACGSKMCRIGKIAK